MFFCVNDNISVVDFAAPLTKKMKNTLALRTNIVVFNFVKISNQVITMIDGISKTCSSVLNENLIANNRLISYGMLVSPFIEKVRAERSN